MLPCNPFREGNCLVKRTLLLVPVAAGFLASQVWAQAPEIIVESYTDGQNAAAFTKVDGNWFESVAKSKAAGLKATKALFKTASSDPGGARFAPEIPADGKYDVFVTYPESGNAAGVVYKVKSAAGEQDVVLDQNGRDDTVPAPANRWVPLGTFEFKKGTDGSVEIRDPGTGKAANSREPNARVYADAVKFVPNTTGKELAAPASKAPAPNAGVAAAPPLSAASQPPLSAAAGKAAGSQPPLSAATGAKTAQMPGLAAAVPKDSGQPGLAAASGTPALPPLNAAVPATSVMPGLAAAVPTASSALASLPAAAAAPSDSSAPPLPALAAASPAPKASEAPPAMPGLAAAIPPAGAPAEAPPLPPLGAPGAASKAPATSTLPPLPGPAAVPPAAPGLPSLAAAASSSAGAALPPPGAPGLPPLQAMPPSAGAPGMPPPGAPGLPPLPSGSAAAGSLPPLSAPPSDLAPPVTASGGDASGIQWTYDIGAAQAIAEKSGKKIFVFFVAKGNRTSAKYEKDYLSAGPVKAELDKYVPLRMDFPMNTKYAYKLGVFGAGSIVVMDRTETVLLSIPFTEVPATPDDLVRKLAEVK